jgi:CDP-glycerol glycerophosphotransferase (TagB/SpsB family)
MCQFAFFGLHMQPESSIDVWSPFFSNQTRVVELLARSLPPTHKLLVKLHKSDVPNYSPAYLEALERFPGVELVSPYADTHELIRKASLVVSIQGTMGLEAALLGKPVIMFGNLLAGLFPSVSIVGKTIDLPALVRAKLTEAAPSRSDILGALARFLEPFYRASTNDWTQVPADSEIDGYVSLFNLLRSHLGDRGLPGATDSVDGSGPSVGDKWYGRLPVRG